MENLFEDSTSSVAGACIAYQFSPFNGLLSLAKEFLLDYPRSRIQCKWFKSMSDFSDIAGFCCIAESSEDISILESLLGYLDIPSGLEGIKLDFVQTSKTKAYLMAYLSDRIHQNSIKTLRLHILGNA